MKIGSRLPRLQVQIKYFQNGDIPEMPEIDAILIFLNGKAPF
jgi:hypothetical protein